MTTPKQRLLSLAAAVAIALSIAVVQAQKADPQAFSATWKLNVAASSNPDGPPAARGGARGGGRSGGGGSESGGGSGGGSLGNEERARFYAMLKVLEQAPKELAIAATDKDVTLTPDGAKPFHHVTDGKKEDLPTGSKSFGNLEVKTKWDAAALKRELKTIDGLTVIETYALSPDGKQLTVSLELKSQIERLADAQKVPIKRIYDRAQ